jgi:acyl carrier protein
MNINTETIRQHIVNSFLYGKDDGLQNDASLLASGVLDSTGVLELVAHLESSYGIKVRDDELIPENLDSINAIVAFLSRKQAAPVSS